MEFVAPDTDGVYSLATTQDGSLWFTPVSLWKFYVGRVSPHGDIEITQLAGRATVIRADMDGTVWTKLNSSSLAHISAAGVIAEYRVPAIEIGDIAIGDDDSVWM